ncbi:hypothetical protein GIB67_037126 [Kingdonia uniflora]|uniref:Uncharacterized protein n=1 Tax=Kingdonia uniflora TaxID=39325 RepID=A0A7J7LI28_9MAGN|nr:hypothetical protein GIB67_037126 [Kingdonia uniflora]
MMIDNDLTSSGPGAIVDVLPMQKESNQDGGGYASEDGRMNCGYSSFREKRASMEDFYDAKMSKIDSQTVSILGYLMVMVVLVLQSF